MAEVNTGSSDKQSFIFGQNMEERVIKNSQDDDETGEGSSPTGENGSEESSEVTSSEDRRDQPRTLLRPSAFTPSGILAPSRLGPNPFVARPAAATNNAAALTTEGVLAASRLAANPFAAKVPSQPVSAASSDSEDEKKEKHIVKPAHFNVAGPGSGAPHIGKTHFVTESPQKNSTPSKFVLRPSALERQTVNFSKGSTGAVNKTSFKLDPPKLQSPLIKLKQSGDDSEKSEEAQSSVAHSSEAQKRLFGGESEVPTSTTGGTTDVSPNSAGAASSCEEKEASKENIFTPTKAGKDGTSSADSSSPKGGGNFIFGQNIHERVTNAAPSVSSTTKPPGGGAEGGGEVFVFGQNLADRVTAVKDQATPSKGPPANEKESEKDGEAAQKDKSDTATGNGDLTSPTRTLEESAAAHQAKQVKPELQKVECITGEENESNVFQINTKLFAFDSATQSWLERGRGLLRLNDMSASDSKSFQSRLIMRTHGCLRVVLNTKVWAGMMVDRASNKSIRITAVDTEDNIRIFLIMANPKDADQIFSAIDWRVQQLKIEESKEAESQEATTTSSQDDPEQTTKTSTEKKRPQEEPAEETGPTKKARMDPEQRRDVATEESNDSSTLDPETEASNESFSSTIKSSSSE